MPRTRADRSRRRRGLMLAEGAAAHIPTPGGCGIAVPGLRQLSPAPRGWRRAFAGSRTRPAQACRSPHAGCGSARAVLLLDPAARGRARGVNRRGRSQTSEIRNRKEGKSERRKWKIKDGRSNSRSPGDTEPDTADGETGVADAAIRRATAVGAVAPAAAAQHTVRTRRRPLRVYRWAR